MRIDDQAKIRGIEKVIDGLHISHPAFYGTKAQVLFELLSAFQNLCSFTLIYSTFNSLALRTITNYMDALNQALHWVEESELSNASDAIVFDISKERYLQCVSLLNDYAYPYSVICSGYIAYSRKRFVAEIDGNTVTFDVSPDYNDYSWNDILREMNDSSSDSFMDHLNLQKIIEATSQLQENVSIQDQRLCYSLTKEIIDSFLDLANEQWNATKTLPPEWRFDFFSMDEYRKVWTCICALCFIHFSGNQAITNPKTRLQNSLMVQSLDVLINFISSVNELDKRKIEKILNYITFDATKCNADIMYQPIIVLSNNIVIIAPMLFMGSRPERNLLALVSSKKDFEHSKEVNNLEGIMVQEIESVITRSNTLKTAKHKKLGGHLPDIDFGLLDTTTNTALICELKWFLAADSSKEVYAREDEITHGCEQIESVMTYAMVNRSRFIKQVFDVDNGECVDLFCCVIARHNIRSKHKYVPVIDLQKFKELLLTKPVNNVFHIIRNREYDEPFPENASISHQVINYGDYTFKIPAIRFESIPRK